MHGYFIEMRAYQKLLSVADPFAFERYRKELINQKLNSMREKRIQVSSAKPQVNSDFAKDLLGTKKLDTLMKDDRFGKMFTDTEFKIDKGSEAYKLIKPQEKKRQEDFDSD